MLINPSKSSCSTFCPRYDAMCVNIITRDRSVISWIKSIKYLGIVMQSSRSFNCIFDISRKSFYKSFNTIFCSTTADVVIAYIF